MTFRHRKCDESFTELRTERLKQDAERLLGETNEVRERSLRELHELVDGLSKEDKEILDTSDRSLIRFLRGKKFRVQKAFTCIQNLIAFRKEHPDWCKESNPQEFAIFSKFFNILPVEADEGGVIIMARPAIGIKLLGDSSFRASNPHAMVRFNIWLMNALSYNQLVQVYGLYMINSFNGFTFYDNITLSSVAPVSERLAIFQFISKCCPFRLKGIYILHQPAYLTWLWGVISLFLNPKLTQRFNLCGDDYSRLKNIKADTSHLPKFLGGEAPDEATFDFIAEEDALQAVDM